MKIDPITNNIVKIGAELTGSIMNCSSFFIATAFIDASAIDLMECCLRSNKKLIKGELLIGVYGCFNRKVDLMRLTEIAKKYSEKFQVNISKDRSFHWKYYNFEKASSNIAYVGSANFTNGGLETNSELLIRMTESKNSSKSSFEKIQSSYRKQWNNSEPISKFPVDEYPIIKRSNSRVKGSKAFNAFFSKKKNEEEESISKNGNAIAFYLTSDLKSSTEKKILGYNPSWEKSNIDYFVCANKVSFEYALNAKQVLMISRERRGIYSYMWVLVIDSCDEVKTEDGKYFIAYKVKGKEKSLSREQQGKLLDILGISLTSTKKKFSSKVLGSNQLLEIQNILP